MRNFIIVGHRAVTNQNFTLNDLPGSSGRMDILARCVNSAFQLSHDIRRDVEITLVLLGPDEPPKSIRFIGSELKYLNPDERSTGALIRNALIKYSTNKPKTNNKNHDEECGMPNEMRASPGIYISNLGFNEVLNYYSTISSIVYLHETGNHLETTDFGTVTDRFTFVLSDHEDLTTDEERVVREQAKYVLSIGPKVLHTDQCIVLIHNFLDKLR